MYLIKSDGKIIYDPRIEEAKVLSARCILKANSVCSASFSILNTHPRYTDLKKLSSVIEIYQDNDVIFRGRMTDDSRKFHKQLVVDVEGVLACANDTIIPPFVLENKTLTWGNNTDTCDNDNVVEFFLGWVLARHNEHVKEWQKLKLGDVLVSDPDFTCASEKHQCTWDVLRSTTFESTLEGYLYVRHEPDGNYLDYVASFPLDNNQHVTLTENVLDVVTESDGNGTYTAILPVGKDGLTLGGTTLVDLPEDCYQDGDYIYFKSRVNELGWICVPVSESSWDVTDVTELQKKAVDRLSGNTLLFPTTTTIKAVDLHFSDKQISAFKPYRNTWVDIPTHEIKDAELPLAELEIDLLNAQNTIITLGSTTWSLLGSTQQEQRQTQHKIESVQNELKQNTVNMSEIENQLLTQRTQLINDCNKIILAALESYVETSNFEQYQETVSAQLQILADEIEMTFTNVTEQITNVDGDLQAEINRRIKHITFSDNGIAIGAGENAMRLELDNDKIMFKKNGVQFGWWDGVDFHTGNIVVEVNERAQFGNFAFVPRSDGSLMFLKVGG